MSREIVEAVREIEREKGIEQDTLVRALEDALLAAYKKTPGAARHAQVELDDAGDFRVFAVELPADIEERLIEEARERAITELEEAEAQTGERSHTLILDDDLDGRKRFRGTVVEAGEDAVTLATPSGDEIAVPYADIVRGNLIDEGLTP